MEDEEQLALDLLVNMMEKDDDDDPQESTSSAQQAKQEKKIPKYREISNPDDFLREALPLTEVQNKSVASLVHAGDTDSSDDEDNRYFEEQNYNEYGRKVKHLLTAKHRRQVDTKPATVVKSEESTWKAKPAPTAPKLTHVTPKSVKGSPCDIFAEPLSGIRIV